MKVKELDGIEAYLKSRNIYVPYLDAKTHLEAGRYSQVQFKKRQPKSAEIFQFRITRKYRALCVKRKEGIVVTEISDHQ